MSPCGAFRFSLSFCSSLFFPKVLALIPHLWQVPTMAEALSSGDYEEKFIILIRFSLNSSTLKDLYLLFIDSPICNNLFDGTFSQSIFFWNKIWFFKIVLKVVSFFLLLHINFQPLPQSLIIQHLEYTQLSVLFHLTAFALWFLFLALLFLVCLF